MSETATSPTTTVAATSGMHQHQDPEPLSAAGLMDSSSQPDSRPSLRAPRSAKISFSVDALLSGGNNNNNSSSANNNRNRRSPSPSPDEVQHQQLRQYSEQLARFRLSIQAQAQAAAVAAAMGQQPKDLSLQAPRSGDDEGRSASATTTSPPPPSLQGSEPGGAGGGSRSADEGPTGSCGSEPDLNVMDDSDEELLAEEEAERAALMQAKEKASPLVPQPIHAGLQRPGHGGGSGPPYQLGPTAGSQGPGHNWPAPGFPHSLASFAWLPPPPHPHSPHAHLYNPHGPNSPNGKASSIIKFFFICSVSSG
ncbi:hypothetical protein QAD02_019374 [Eretmocerus hayati]|uniref:Uncharacterized protein n=1 Tax=Eretmocerus hayati TaxID=131215 RepID=A0ACC2PJF1_9HYME|nr:hypothetical protein QAD02_019374 [Eretmocerus hayati]